MRIFLLALLCVTLPSLIRAQSGSYEIVVIDAAKGTLICKHNDQLQTFRTRAGVEITLNGVVARLDELEPGMKVKLASADPGVATSLTAYGVRSHPLANSNASPAPSTNPSPATGTVPESAGIRKLRESLAGTKWRWPDSRLSPKKGWFRLNADGSATAGWHDGNRSWRAVSDNTIELRITGHQSVQVIHFNADFTVGITDTKTTYTRLDD